MGRKKLSNAIVADVLYSSARRCCYCFGFNMDLEVKTGQIAHLDRNADNNKFDNLAWMCQEHHDAYDTRRSQSKNYKIFEAKKYRDELYGLIDNKRRDAAANLKLSKNNNDVSKENLSEFSLEILKLINERIYQIAGGIMYENMLIRFGDKSKLDIHLIKLLENGFIINNGGVYKLLHKAKMLLYGSTL